MRVRLPPFKAIEAFVAAGQLHSFTEAAAILNITVPAVSRRIQGLEAELGVRLFHRGARGLTVTKEGEAYLDRLAPAIEVIRGASDRVREGARANAVRLALPPSFAASWLVPRLPRFYAQHCDIEIDLRSTSFKSDADAAEVDLAIQRGVGVWPNLQSERLLDIDAFPVCSADLLDGPRSLRAPAEITGFPLLASSYAPEMWPEWFGTMGLGDAPRASHVFDRLHLVYQAAASGLGVALGEDVTAAPYLEDGRLVRPFAGAVRRGQGYYVLGRSAELVRRPVARFRSWLIAEAQSWKAQMSCDRQAS